MKFKDDLIADVKDLVFSLVKPLVKEILDSNIKKTIIETQIEHHINDVQEVSLEEKVKIAEKFVETNKELFDEPINMVGFGPKGPATDGYVGWLTTSNALEQPVIIKLPGEPSFEEIEKWRKCFEKAQKSKDFKVFSHNTTPNKALDLLLPFIKEKEINNPSIYKLLRFFENGLGKYIHMIDDQLSKEDYQLLLKLYP